MVEIVIENQNMIIENKEITLQLKKVYMLNRNGNLEEACYIGYDPFDKDYVNFIREVLDHSIVRYIILLDGIKIKNGEFIVPGCSFILSKPNDGDYENLKAILNGAEIWGKE